MARWLRDYQKSDVGGGYISYMMGEAGRDLKALAGPEGERLSVKQNGEFAREDIEELAGC
jgi:hypothetical protein